MQDPRSITLQFYQAINPPAKPTQLPPKLTQPPSNPTQPTHQIQPTHGEPRPPMVSHDHPTHSDPRRATITSPMASHDEPRPPHPRQATTAHEQTPDHGNLNPTYPKPPCLSEAQKPILKERRSFQGERKRGESVGEREKH